MSEKLKLVNGCIPVGDVCPAMKDNLCGFAEGCGHEGVDHKVPFSCGALRFWSITKKGRELVEEPTFD